MYQKLLRSFLIILLGLQAIKLEAQKSLKDFDGNNYNSILIFTREWMAENLNVSHYSNGDIIPQVQDAAKWANLRTGAWCYYEFKKGDHKTRGRLYNGYAILDPRGLAPAGWSIPMTKEWDDLYRWPEDSSNGYLTDDTVKLRLFLRDDISTMNCSENRCYFRRGNGKFGTMKCLGLWWLPENDDMTFQMSRCESYDGYFFGMAGLPEDWKNYGFFVRCVKKQ